MHQNRWQVSSRLKIGEYKIGSLASDLEDDNIKRAEKRAMEPPKSVVSKPTA